MGSQEGGGTVGAGTRPGAELIAKLDAARGDLPRIVALLWSWLGRHSTDLGSRVETLSAIRNRVEEEKGGHHSITDESLAWLAEDPLPHAAELLARIGHRLTTNDSKQNLGGRSFDETTDIDGRRVVVVARHSRLATMVGGGHPPPAAVENPSLTTLVPRLVVNPVTIRSGDGEAGRGIELEFQELDESPDWDLAWAVLDEALTPAFDSDHEKGESKLEFKVHLDPLREHGLDGWLYDEDRGDGDGEEKESYGRVGHYDAAKLGADGVKRCAEAAEEAIANAAGPGILLMPELAAAPGVETAIKDKLRERRAKGEPTPTLTVVGLYHRKPAPGTGLESELVKPEDLAPWVNEAIVLGPTGEELWRHRKLSYAEAREDDRSDRRKAENIQLGTKLIVVPTPLGHLGIAICLDSFAPHVCKRLEASATEVVLVPSLSRKIDRHRYSLTQIVQRLSGIAFVCNRSPVESDNGIEGWNSDESRSFCAIQHKGAIEMPAWDGSGHPSFVFDLKENLAT